MASRTRDHGKPTFYLDHSTLCDAFRAHAVGATTPAHEAYRPLLPWIERVAAEANLCLSIVHLAELGRWGDRTSADAIARWYERLPIVWVRGLAAVQESEEDYWTKVAAGVHPARDVDPCAPSLLSAFERLDIALASTMLAEKQLLVALVDLRTRLGRAPQLSVGRHPEKEAGFVRDLMATWP